MAFSLDDAWRDTTKLLRANASLLLPLAGAFFLLPLIIYSFLVPEFQTPQSQNQQVVAQALAQYLASIFIPLLMLVALVLLGTAAIYHLLLDRDRPTVGDAIAGGVRSWPSLLLLGLILIVVQFVLLIVTSLLSALLGLGQGAASLIGIPLTAIGVYVSARFVPAGPSIVAERLRGPGGFVRRALGLTEGKGWRIAAFIFALSVIGFILVFVVQIILGSLLTLLAGEAGGQIAGALSAVLVSALLTVLTVAYAAVYRQLTRAAPEASVPSTGI